MPSHMGKGGDLHDMVDVTESLRFGQLQLLLRAVDLVV